MSIYEFECPDCDILFEERLSPAQLDEVVVECPICYTPHVKKVISAPTFFISRGRSNPSGAEVDFGESGAEEAAEPGETPEASSLSHPAGCACCWNIGENRRSPGRILEAE
jgi:putative FmdB family regulatory protein